jgi:menaquinone-specific isochorismate synthase
MSHIAASLDRCPWPEAASRLRRIAEQIWRDEGGHAPGRILRASVLTDRVQPLDWLAGVPDDLRFYGATRDRSQALEIGGLGIADEAVWHEPVDTATVFQRLKATLNISSNGLRYYGGFRFSRRAVPDDDWRDFGVSRFVVPRYELRSAPGGSQLTFHFKPDEAAGGFIQDAMDRLADLPFEDRIWEDTFPPPRSRVDEPDHDGWSRNVNVALSDFEAGVLEKIVLARKAVFGFEGHLDPITLMHRLKSATPECFHFCYMPSSDIAFVGASPERLYRREGRHIETEAVAGTRMRSLDPEEDERLGAALLASDKDQREHAFVTAGIRRTLEPLCESLDMSATPALLKLARGQHLYTRVNGLLREEADDAAILDALHPTPALGGSPTERALARIAELEPFDRGWYAAPVGWVSRDAAEFAVAIRSGLVQPRRLALFSGAGIVRGSTPESDWEEIELKIRDFIKVLTGT